MAKDLFGNELEPRAKRRVVLDPGAHAHTMASVEWWTRRRYLRAAREWVGGSFDLDPATTEHANRAVGAKTFYTVQTNGLDPANPWRGAAWMNPPSPARPWVERWVRELVAGNIWGVALAYNADQMNVWAELRREVTRIGPVFLMHPDHRIRCVRTVANARATVDRQILKLAETVIETAELPPVPLTSEAFRFIEAELEPGPHGSRVRQLWRERSKWDELPADHVMTGDQPAHPSVFLGFPSIDRPWPEAFFHWQRTMGQFGLCTRSE